MEPVHEWSAFFDITPDLFIVAGKDGYFQKVNPSVIEKLGYSQEELLSRPIAEFIHPEDREMTAKIRAELLAGKPLMNFENRYLNYKGDIVWLHWTSIYLPGSEVVFAIAKDITRRRNMEEEIREKYNKFKNLATHFKTSQEKDRKQFSYHLQEDVAQLASVIKMDLSSINASALPGDVQERIEHSLVVTDMLIQSTQRISFGISPRMLEDFGLDDTLDWLCVEFSRLYKIPCRYTAEYDSSIVSEEMQNDFFRLCQDALLHVLDHATAQSIQIYFEGVPEEFCITMSDTGEGFHINRQECPGYVQVKEQANSINGNVQLMNQSGGGTMMCITINSSGYAE